MVIDIGAYVEVNIISIIISIILFMRMFSDRSINPTSNVIIRRLIVALWVLCLSDIAAVVLRGKVFPGAWWLIQIANLTYFLMISVIGYIWMFYVFNKIDLKVKNWKIVLLSLPLAAVIIIAAINPWTNWLFSINDANEYVRGPGLPIHWVLSWSYIVLAGILSILAVFKAKSWSKKQEYIPLVFFLVLPLIGTVVQMAFYGITSTQAGIVLALFLITLRSQQNQITIDELTGANNRKALRDFVDGLIHRPTPPELTIIMIDVNHFKSINDTFGHNVGDEALIVVTNAIKTVVSDRKEKFFMCRYGGDEFVIVGKDVAKEAVLEVGSAIKSEVQAFSEANSKPYELSVSFGSSKGTCVSFEDFNRYLRAADEAMYEDKKKDR